MEERRALYDRWTVQLGIERVVGGSQFPDFLNAYETAKTKGSELLETVLAEHTSAKSQWLETEIRPLLAASLNRSDLPIVLPFMRIGFLAAIGLPASSAWNSAITQLVATANS